jgi:hypothetical protein
MGSTCNAYGEGRNVFKILVGNLRVGDCFGYQGVGARIILKCIFKEERETDSCVSRQGSAA